MTEQQRPKLAGAFVEHQDRFSDLTTEEAQWAITDTASAIAVCVAAIKVAFAKAHGGPRIHLDCRCICNHHEVCRER